MVILCIFGLLWNIDIKKCEGRDDQLYPVHSGLFNCIFFCWNIIDTVYTIHNRRPFRYFKPGWPKVRTGPACPVEVQSRTDVSLTRRTSPVATKVLANQSRIPALTSHRKMLIDIMELSWNTKFKRIKKPTDYFICSCGNFQLIFRVPCQYFWSDVCNGLWPGWYQAITLLFLTGFGYFGNYIFTLYDFIHSHILYSLN